MFAPVKYHFDLDWFFSRTKNLFLATLPNKTYSESPKQELSCESA